jgi:hypothetical protein
VKESQEQWQARRDLLAALLSDELSRSYGIHLSLQRELEQRLIEEPMGDQLDVLLCAIQAAWAYGQRTHDPAYGIPAGYELDGWIVDPLTLAVYQQKPSAG